MMKVFVAIVLFAAFALPAPSASAHQDVITLQAYEELLKSGASTDGMTKTVISSPLLEEALVSYSKNKLGGLEYCGETCYTLPCYTVGCFCMWPHCMKASLEQAISAAANTLLEEALVAFAKKDNLGDIPFCGETCTSGTCHTPGCTCGYWPFCTKDSVAMCKTEL